MSERGADVVVVGAGSAGAVVARRLVESRATVLLLEAVRDYVRKTAITYHHQVGTCKMGTDAAAVVDPRLRVHGLDGLRVADASIMPTVTTGNTNAPSIMIGERAAEFLLADG